MPVDGDHSGRDRDRLPRGNRLSQARRYGFDPEDWSYEPYRREAVGWVRGWLGVLTRRAAAGVHRLDQILRRIDEGARRARDDAVRRTGLDPATLTTESLLARAPGSVGRSVRAVGAGLAAVGRGLGRLFPFAPRDREWKRAAGGLALLLVVVIVGNFAAPPTPMPLPGAWRPVFVGYFENGWGGIYGDSYPTLQRRAEYVDVIMPFWYSIHPDGSIEDRGARRDVVDFAHRSGIPVVPLFNNAKVGASAGFLVDPAARQEAAAEIKALVDSMEYDGVHIDFELLPPYWRNELTSFIAEIRAALGSGKHLSVAVFPQVDVSSDISGIYDYAALSGSCDFIVLMGYDHHYSGGPAGPVSPYDWIESNITHALYDWGVPAGKLVLAVGGYGYDWAGGGGGATNVPSRYATDLARRYGATPQWDSASQNPFFTYYEGRTRHDVWYQDERVMAQRIAQARKYGLRGLALWRLGYETPETWTVVSDELGPRLARR